VPLRRSDGGESGKDGERERERALNNYESRELNLLGS